MANLKLRCPACGAEFRLDEGTQAADLLALDQAAAAFGTDWDLFKEYLDCFQGQRKMKAGKRLRLARELWAMWEAGNFSIGGAWYRIGRPEFREALRATCNQVSATGLTNHNYLKKVLVAAAEKTSRREERELREKEEGLRMAGGDARPTVPLGEKGKDPAWRAELTRLGQAVRRAKTPEARAEAKAACETFLKKKRGESK